MSRGPGVEHRWDFLIIVGRLGSVVEPEERVGSVMV